MIPLDLLDENPLNPRRSMDEAALNELAQSIKNSGITQPLLVRVQHIDGLIEERYEIVCGHRRAAAAYRLELLEVPCNVREMNDQEAAEIALVDNLQRVDVAALDEAEAFGALLALHGTVEAVAKRVGKEVGHVAKRLKLRTLGIHQRDSLRARS
jgi:ParB family chromosome partitioning protein